MSNARLRWSLACLAAAAVAACKGKDPAPPPQTQPPATAAPATTTTTTTTTTVPTPPPIWREARWGMSAAQVLAAFPAEAQRLPQAVNFGPQIPGASDVAIPAYELDSVRYRVLFGFEADALNRVHLSAPKAAETTCGDLEKAITEKHAEPADRSSTMTNLRNDVVVWKRPDQTITLTCSEARGLGYRQVMLDYAAPAGEAVSAR